MSPVTKLRNDINLIIKDLDDAIDALPWKWTGDDEGRFTKATVMALKGRILLYYASRNSILRTRLNAGKQPIRTIKWQPNK